MTDTNAMLQADNMQLEKANADLEADKRRLEQKLKSQQVATAILLAVCGGLGVGLVAEVAGATVQIAFSSAAGVFFGVIVASLRILAYMHG